MNEITLDHIRQAVAWARKAKDEPQPIDGLVRKYAQNSYDCGTSCCILGAANILAGNGRLKNWGADDVLERLWDHGQPWTALASLMSSSDTTLEQFEDFLASIKEEVPS